MGLTRQKVRRIVNELVALGICQLVANPNHRRAPLVRMTPLGEATFRTIAARQAPWVTDLAAGLRAAALREALGVLRALGQRLERQRTQEADHD
jgi:DNA-binding MarR family transcriptional regulator